MTFELWSVSQLNDAIDSLMEDPERDQSMRAELTAQQENIYSALGGPSLRHYFGVIEAAVNSHIALSDAIESRAVLPDVIHPLCCCWIANR